MSTRRRLPNRRHAEVLCFEHEGVRYRASLGRFADESPAEMFLDVGKFNAAIQVNAETSAILVSLLLQHNVDLATIRRSVRGVVGRALDLLAEEGR